MKLISTLSELGAELNKLGETHPMHWSAKEEEEATIERSRRHKSPNAFFDCGCGSGHFLNLTYSQNLGFLIEKKPNKELIEHIDTSELDKNSWIEIHTCSPSREEKGRHFLTYGIFTQHTKWHGVWRKPGFFSSSLLFLVECNREVFTLVSVTGQDPRECKSKWYTSSKVINDFRSAFPNSVHLYPEHAVFRGRHHA